MIHLSRRALLRGSACAAVLAYAGSAEAQRSAAAPAGLHPRPIGPMFAPLGELDFQHGRPIAGRRALRRFHEARSVNLSELQFRRHPPSRVHMRDLGPPAPRLRATPPNLQIGPRTRAPWNSFQGRRAFANRIILANPVRETTNPIYGSLANGHTLDSGAPLCTAPHVTVPLTNPSPYSGNYDEQFTDAGKSAVTNYITVGGVVSPYNNENTAQTYASQVPVSMPFYLPFQDPLVVPGGGWWYDYSQQKLHGAIDFSKTQYDGSDPSFMLYAVADGRVVATDWDDRVGNYLIIEHTAPNGDKYRSFCCHMRNGKDHDIQKAMGVTYSAQAQATFDRPYLYYLFVRLPMTPDLAKLWGTNQQTIQVAVGDTVYAGQHVGWSGNTGWGGAGWGLDQTGHPTDPNTGNNHLHLYFSYATVGTSDFTLIDSYGVYSDQNYASGCYDVGANTLGPRFWAPFLTAFHNVPIDIFLAGFHYYPSMGYGLQTLSVYDTPDGLKCAGAFDHRLSPNWYCRVNMTAADLHTYYLQYDAQGLRPRDVSVLVSGGVPYFTVIWGPKAPGESAAMWVDQTDADFNTRWQQLVTQGHMRVEDHFVYNVTGQDKHATIYVGGGDTSFYEYHYYSGGDFQTLFDQLNAQNFRLTSINVLNQGNQNSYGGVFRPMPGSWYAYDLSVGDYQTKFTELVSQGYWLHKVQGYAGGGRIAAIWNA